MTLLFSLHFTFSIFFAKMCKLQLQVERLEQAAKRFPRTEIIVRCGCQAKIAMDGFVRFSGCVFSLGLPTTFAFNFRKIKHSPAHSQSNTNQQNYDNQLECPFFIEQ